DRANSHSTAEQPTMSPHQSQNMNLECEHHVHEPIQGFVSLICGLKTSWKFVLSECSKDRDVLGR
ncbi:hypothetical protein Q6264_28540, partial [Klebsiella pneumoniae]|uniref:hypothetical protein n=1 Tax=Klebsiella pneumoniae TaxID=573 RepID=UPI0027304B51